MPILELKGLTKRFGGLLAWLAWMFLHVSVLIGFRNRAVVMGSWIYGYVFSRRGSRLITRTRNCHQHQQRGPRQRAR